MFRNQKPGQIYVSNPSKAYDAANPLTPYVAYDVRSSAYPNAIVQRRYNDFLWLSDMLVETLPGLIVPPLPEKQVIGRFEDDFIEYRMRALEKFLNRISSHEKLYKSPYFETFLMASDTTFNHAKIRNQSAMFSAAVSTASWLGNAISSMAPSLMNRGEASERTAVDIQFDDISEKTNKLVGLMTAVRDQSYEMVKASCESSVALSELSSSLSMVGEIESNYDPTVGATYTHTGAFMKELAAETGKAAHAAIVSFEEPLIEQLSLLQSVQSALALRESARSTYLMCKAETISAEQAHLRVIGVEGKRDMVIPRKQLFEAAQKAEKDAKTRLELITEEFLEDYQRFKADKAVDMRAILVKYANLQLRLCERSEKLGLAVAAKLAEKVAMTAVKEPATATSVDAAATTTEARTERGDVSETPAAYKSLEDEPVKTAPVEEALNAVDAETPSSSIEVVREEPKAEPGVEDSADTVAEVAIDELKVAEMSLSAVAIEDDEVEPDIQENKVSEVAAEEPKTEDDSIGAAVGDSVNETVDTEESKESHAEDVAPVAGEPTTVDLEDGDEESRDV